jgi:hypothetical protein
MIGEGGGSEEELVVETVQLGGLEVYFERGLVEVGWMWKKECAT